MARKPPESGWGGRLSPVPTTGERGQRAGDGLWAYKEQPGSEHNYGFLQDPLIVKSLVLQKPERIAALGLVVGLARRRWRLGERTRRGPGEPTGPPWPGGPRRPRRRPRPSGG